MAYSVDNLEVLEQWLLPSAIWFSDAESLFSTDDASTISGSLAENAYSSPSTSLSPSPNPNPNPDTPRSVQSVTISGSDPDTDSNRKRSFPAGPVKGRVSKRKPRPSKKSPTTFITADAENFQQMVQQATGVNFSSMPPVLKPQAKRIGAAAGAGCGPIHYCLPTLDTSAFLFDHPHHQQPVVGRAVDAHSGAGKTRSPPDFDQFACFPTLDSWKVL